MSNLLFLSFFIFFLLKIVFIVAGESSRFDVVEENLSSIRWTNKQISYEDL